MKIRPVGAELFDADGRTDRKLMVAFRNFAKAPKMRRTKLPGTPDAKAKLSLYRPGQSLTLMSMLPEFPENRHMKVAMLSALRTGRLYPQKRPLALISVTG